MSLRPRTTPASVTSNIYSLRQQALAESILAENEARFADRLKLLNRDLRQLKRTAETSNHKKDWVDELLSLKREESKWRRRFRQCFGEVPPPTHSSDLQQDDLVAILGTDTQIEEAASAMRKNLLRAVDAVKGELEDALWKAGTSLAPDRATSAADSGPGRSILRRTSISATGKRQRSQPNDVTNETIERMRAMTDTQVSRVKASLAATRANIEEVGKELSRSRLDIESGLSTIMKGLHQSDVQERKGDQNIEVLSEGDKEGEVNDSLPASAGLLKYEVSLSSGDGDCGSPILTDTNPSIDPIQQRHRKREYVSFGPDRVVSDDFLLDQGKRALTRFDASSFIAAHSSVSYPSNPFSQREQGIAKENSDIKANNDHDGGHSESHAGVENEGERTLVEIPGKGGILIEATGEETKVKLIKMMMEQLKAAKELEHQVLRSRLVEVEVAIDEIMMKANKQPGKGMDKLLEKNEDDTHANNRCQAGSDNGNANINIIYKQRLPDTVMSRIKLLLSQYEARQLHRPVRSDDNGVKGRVGSGAGWSGDSVGLSSHHNTHRTPGFLPRTQQAQSTKKSKQRPLSSSGLLPKTQSDSSTEKGEDTSSHTSITPSTALIVASSSTSALIDPMSDTPDNINHMYDPMAVLRGVVDPVPPVLLDRLKTEYPTLSVAQLVAGAQRVMAQRYYQRKRIDIEEGYARKMAETEKELRATEARVVKEKEEAMERERRRESERLRKGLAEMTLIAGRARQDASALTNEMEKLEEQERDRLAREREEEKELARREADMLKLEEYRKIKEEEDERQRELLRKQAEVDAVEYAAQAERNKERLEARSEIDREKVERRLAEEAAKKADREQLLAQLEALRMSVAGPIDEKVKRDPERVLQHTEALVRAAEAAKEQTDAIEELRGKFEKLGLEGYGSVILKPNTRALAVDGFSEDRLNQDPRYRLSVALNNAGVGGSTAARQALLSLGPSRGARRDNVSTLKLGGSDD